MTGAGGALGAVECVQEESAVEELGATLCIHAYIQQKRVQRGQCAKCRCFVHGLVECTFARHRKRYNLAQRGRSGGILTVRFGPVFKHYIQRIAVHRTYV